VTSVDVLKLETENRDSHFMWK